MKLYILPGACSLAAHIALNWLGIDYELVVLTHDEVGAEPYRRFNPAGVVPTLVLDDGAAITEALAVQEYIADAYPEASLGVASNDVIERTRLNEALADLVTNVHDTWAPFFLPDRFMTEKAFEDSAKEAAIRRLDDQYARLDRLMTDRAWRLFDRRTVVDAYLYVMCMWKDKTPKPLAAYPALAALSRAWMLIWACGKPLPKSSRQPGYRALVR